mmetsp:Transcript_39722/g.119390  ORF Transcript_39722/g.119390 Transcript_39722/m.119390 type:complete len:490 (-) Transcript_39722:1952-3421(-)
MQCSLSILGLLRTRETGGDTSRPTMHLTQERKPADIRHIHLLRIVPVLVRVRSVHKQRHGRLIQPKHPRRFHALQDLLERLLGRLLRTLEYDLIVNLHEQYPPQPLENLGSVDLDHGHHDDVGRSPLDGGVDARPLGVPHELPILPHGVGELTVSSHEGAGVPLPPCERLGLRLPLQHLRTGAVPRVEHILGLLPADAPILAEAVGSLPVRDGEVERLGLASLGGEFVLEHGLVGFALAVIPLQQALAVVHLLSDVIEHPQGRAGVKVAPGLEGLDHRFALGHARQQSQFELPVISHDEVVPRPGLERLAYLVLVLLERRLILKIRTAGRQTSRLGVEVHRSVDASVLVGEKLEGCEEVGDHGVDGSDGREAEEGDARVVSLLPSAEEVVRRPVLGRIRERIPRQFPQHVGGNARRPSRRIFLRSHPQTRQGNVHIFWFHPRTFLLLGQYSLQCLIPVPSYRILENVRNGLVSILGRRRHFVQYARGEL